MSASLIRSRAMVTHTIDRHRWNEITDGDVLQEDGTIVEIGIYRELGRKHPNVPVIGSGNEVMVSGCRRGARAAQTGRHADARSAGAERYVLGRL